jgi:hypothetical protein
MLVGKNHAASEQVQSAWADAIPRVGSKIKNPARQYSIIRLPGAEHEQEQETPNSEPQNRSPSPETLNEEGKQCHRLTV